MINNLQVYVINLKQDIERLKNISYELKKQNISNFEVIEAVDANEINKKDLDFSISKKVHCDNLACACQGLGRWSQRWEHF